MSGTAKGRGPRATILVTGDIVVDHHLYVGRRRKAWDGVVPGTVDFVEFGGAALVERLLTPEPDEGDVPWRAVLGLVKDSRLYPHCYAIWQRTEAKDGEQGGGSRWHVARELGYGPWRAERPVDEIAADEKDAESAVGVEVAACPQVDPEAPQTPDILVVDDAGAGFRDIDACWPACFAADRDPPRWVVWKMAGKLDGGALWRHASKHESIPSRTLLVVSAADLRRAGHAISCGLSWERTALDTARALRGITGGPLATCRHVVVSFESAGALWADLRDAKHARCTLVFDPRSIEADPAAVEQGKVFGFQACLTGGIAWALASAAPKSPAEDPERDVVLDGVRRGLTARRVLHGDGHVAARGALPSGFPARRLRELALRGAPQSFTHVEVPLDADPDGWTILEDAARASGVSGPLYAEARLVALHGLSALAGTPSLQVGEFATVDRQEIEGLRRIQHLVREYEAVSPQKQPLSIAVFGAPGAGKSFIVKQIARAALDRKTPFLEINLSQFYDERELIGAFHRVRDLVLGGRTPFVLWDEFDAEEYRWLRLLLAPMQDGTFQDGQTVHPIGKCVFVFAGGTSSTLGGFGPRAAHDDPEAAREARVWRFAKGPDFVSRLHGHLDVLGPNQRLREPNGRGTPAQPDDTDVCFPIRRALFLRAVARAGTSSIPGLAPELLNVLLHVPKYTHGSRSYERILRTLMQADPPWATEALLSRDDIARDISAECSTFERSEEDGE